MHVGRSALCVHVCQISLRCVSCVTVGLPCVCSRTALCVRICLECMCVSRSALCACVTAGLPCRVHVSVGLPCVSVDLP